MPNLDSLLTSLSNGARDVAFDPEEVISLLNERIDARTADFADIGASLREYLDARNGLSDEFGVIAATWMTMLDTRNSRSEGLALLQWMDGRGSPIARYQLAVTYLDSPDAATHMLAVPMIEGLLQRPDCPARLQAAAHASLATCYGTGQGTVADQAKGIEHLVAGANLGDAACAFALGSMYEQPPRPDRLLPLDYGMAAHYYQIGADADCPSSLSSLAILHMAGAFPEACPTLGYSMMQEAYKSGLSAAGGTLKWVAELAETMPLEQACQEVGKRMMQDRDEMQEILRRMNLPPNMDLLSEEAFATPDIAFALQLMEMLAALRCSGPLQNDEQFARVLDRIGTHEDRMALSQDKAFWQRMAQGMQDSLHPASPDA